MGNVIILKTQINSTGQKSPVSQSWSFEHAQTEFHNWQQTGDFFVELNWVFKVITSPDPIQLKSTGQLSDHSARR